MSLSKTRTLLAQSLRVCNARRFPFGYFIGLRTRRGSASSFQLENNLKAHDWFVRDDSYVFVSYNASRIEMLYNPI